MALGEGAFKNHLAGEAAHLGEVSGDCSEAVEDNLAEGRLIVGNQTYVLAHLKFLLPCNADKLYEVEVVLACQKQIDLTLVHHITAHLVRESDLYAVLIAKPLYSHADGF